MKCIRSSQHSAYFRAPNPRSTSGGFVTVKFQFHSRQPVTLVGRCRLFLMLLPNDSAANAVNGTYNFHATLSHARMEQFRLEY